jgi:hypothetical protein
VGAPGGMIVPVGPGTGAAQDEWAVISPTRAAGIPPIITEVDPLDTMAGPAGTQPATVQGIDWPVTFAAGMFAINTVKHPDTNAPGSPGCGTGVGTGAGG